MLGAMPGFADEDEIHRFDIPAMPASAALNMLGKQANKQLLYYFDEVQGITTQAVVGEYTLDVAIELMLRETGLVVETNDRGVLTVSLSDHESTRRGDGEVNAKSRTGIASAAAALAISTSVDAQDAANIEDEAVVDEIVVTATRIRGGNPTSRLETIDRFEIDQSGFATTEDIARSLTTNFSSRNNGTLSAGTGIAGSEAPFSGTSSINLRGLGEGATLVLVNGRRIAASSYGGQSFVDISTIPLDAIERVEVLNDGTSATYGSDAVAGIVNFILRRDFTGGEVSLSSNDSANDGDSLNGSLMLGTNWDSGHIMGSISIRQEDPITSSKVTSTQDFRSIGGRDLRSLGSQPGTFTSLAGFFPLIPGSGPVVTFRGNQDGTSVTPADAIVITDDADRPRTDLRAPALSADIENIAGFVSVEQAIGERVRLTADMMMSERDTVRVPGPLTFTNAFMLPGLNPYNPFLVPVRVTYVASAEQLAGSEVARSASSVKRLQINPGLDIDLAGSWHARLHVGFGNEKAERSERGILINDLDPLGTPLFAALNATDPGVALNVFGDGSAQNLSTLSGLVEDIPTNPYENELIDASLVFDGNLFSLPGGDVKAAFGIEQKRETLSFTDVLIDASAQATFFDAERTQESTATFAELLVPIIGEANASAIARSLTLSLAARNEDYTFDVESGLQPGNADLDRFTPKVGLAWGVTGDFTARATWGESFRVPGLNDLFTPSFSLPIPAFPDPLDPSGLGFAFNVTFNYGGNPALREQSGESLTIGLEYHPESVAGLRAAVTYSEIEFSDLIGDPFLLFGVIEVVSKPDLFPDSTSRDAGGRLTAVNLIPANISERESESIDLAVNYNFTAGTGDMGIGLRATRTLGLTNVIDPDQPALTLAGTIAGPADLKLRGYVNWARDGWNSALYANYESGYDNNDAQAAFDRIDPYTTVDFQLSHTWGDVGGVLEDVSISLNAINVLGADYPFVDNQGYAYGVDPRRVDLRGRQLVLRMKKSF